MSKHKRKSVLGIPVDLVTRAEMLATMDAMIQHREQGFFLAINPIKLVLAQTNSLLQQTAMASKINFADGVGVVWALKYLFQERVERVPGFEFMLDALSHVQHSSKNVFLIGATEPVIHTAFQKLQQQYPNTKFCGAHHGFLADEKNENSLIERLQHAKPDIVFVGMGVVKQDRFIKKILQETQTPFVMGVGGSFDVIAGTAPRAPEFMLKIGLEWFYRLARQPWRFRRMLNLPRFVGLVIKEKYALKRMQYQG